MILIKTKEELRLEAKKLIRKLSLNKEDFQRKESELINQIKALDEFKQAKTILIYYPLEFEFDLTSLIDLFPEKTWVLPRPIGKGIMLLFQVKNLAEDLRAGNYSLKVPVGTSKLINISELDLVILPGLAFDQSGYRLGYGMGYYDRLLAKLSSLCKTIGVAYKEQIFDSIPKEEHDKAVTKLISIS